MARVTPQNVEAEEHVLGAMMQSPKVADAMAAALDARMFYRESHAALFELICGQSAAGKPCEAIILAGVAEAQGRLDAIGGKLRLVEIVGSGYTISNAVHYADMVIEAWRKRSIVQATEPVIANAYDGVPAQETMSALDGAVMDLHRDFAPARSHVVPLFQGAQFLESRLREPLDEQAGVPTPWSFTDPLKNSCLYVLGGYTADGKTAQAVHFLRAAAEKGVRSGLFSLEMPWEQMIARIAANLGAPAARVLSGNVRQPERDATGNAIARLALLDADIIDHPRITVSDIRRYVRVQRYDFIIVDHLHRFDISEPRYERQELEAVVRGLTDLAREAKIPVLLLSQLSRSGDPKKPYPRPTMSSLRGTAIIEQESTIVWFVWRERDDEQLATEVTHFITAKNRYGRCRDQPADVLGEPCGLHRGGPGMTGGASRIPRPAPHYPTETGCVYRLTARRSTSSAPSRPACSHQTGTPGTQSISTATGSAPAQASATAKRVGTLTWFGAYAPATRRWTCRAS